MSQTFFKKEKWNYLLAILAIPYPRLIKCDAAENWQVGFQDPATPIMEGLPILKILYLLYPLMEHL